MGKLGGSKSSTGGFAEVAADGTEVGRERARRAGAIGGQVSRRRKAALLKSGQEAE